jgi:hypothetical protein
VRDLDVCPSCNFVGWSCLCEPAHPARVTSEEKLQRARRSRLVVAELDSLEVDEARLELLERGRGGARAG